MSVTFGKLASAGGATRSLISGLANTGVSDLASAGMSTMSAGATDTLDSALNQGVASQANVAMAQVAASTEQLQIGAAQQEANSTLHAVESAVATAVKFQNKMSDDAKDAI
jgi:hypothetical protein